MTNATTRVVLAVILLFGASFAASGATSLQVTLPNEATTGASFAFTVTAQNGAVTDTAYSGTVHFTSSDGGATLPADYTFTPGDAGTHSFNATMATAGPFTSTRNQTITATDTGNSSITGMDVTTVKWAADVVRGIRVETPATVDRNASFQGIVSARNADFEVVPSYTGTVHFTGTTGVVLPADYTFTPSDNGSHTFTFSASRGGHHIITAADAADPTISGSGGFDVACPELTATAGNTGPVCNGAPVILLGSSNQSGVTYYWTGPHTWFSNEQNPTAPGPGIYFLEVSNADACRTFATTTVGTITPPQMTLSGSATQACGGDIFTATVDDAASYTNFDWDTSGATILSGQGTSSVQLQTDNSNVTAVVHVRAQHIATGCTATSSGWGVDVDPRYSAEITAPSSACPNAPLTATVPANIDAAFAWTVTHATITSDILNTLHFVPDGTGDVTVTAKVYNNMATCVSTDTALISLNGPTASVDAGLSICSGDSTVIPVALSGNPPFSITWSDGIVQSGIATTQTSRTVTPLETTAYSVTAVSDSLCAGTASGSAVVTVGDEPEILTPPQNAVIARGTKATLTVAAAGAGLEFHWYEGHTGDRSHLVSAGTSPEFETPALEHTTRYWVDVIGACGSTESPAATVAVMGRQRAARH
jgi:Ig-like domain CHU_C associated/PKD-like domain